MARELYHRKARERQTVKKAIASMTLPPERSVGLTAEGAANHALRPTLADTQDADQSPSEAGRPKIFGLGDLLEAAFESQGVLELHGELRCGQQDVEEALRRPPPGAHENRRARKVRVPCRGRDQRRIT